MWAGEPVILDAPERSFFTIKGIQSMWKQSAVLAIFLVAATVSHAQDVVQLRNGKQVCGTVIIDEQKSSDGFWVKNLQTGGTLYIKWTQVLSHEKHRLLEQPATATIGLMDGVRIVTKSGRFILGVLVDNTGIVSDPVPDSVSALPATIHVKIGSSERPVMVPRSSVESYEKLRIRESDAFSATEMVALREAKLDANDAAGLYQLGEFALGLELFQKTKTLWLAAAQLDPSWKEKVDSRVASLDKIVAEAGARAALDAILKLAQKGKFAEALAAVDRFAEDFGETETAAANGDLAEKIEKEKEAYEKNRTAYLAKKIPDAWRSLRKSLLVEYAKKKYKCAEARNKIASLDQELKDKLSEQFNCPPEDVIAAWEKRDTKKQTSSMSDSSWLYQPGGNGGEIDYQAGGGSEEGEEGAVDDFVRRFGGKQKGQQGKNQKKQDPPKQLKTADEWWSKASSSKRRAFLSAEYALTSANVKIIKKVEKKCSTCRGEGTKREKRNGEYVQVLCPRCHGGSTDFTVTFD